MHMYVLKYAVIKKRQAMCSATCVDLNHPLYVDLSRLVYAQAVSSTDVASTGIPE